MLLVIRVSQISEICSEQIQNILKQNGQKNWILKIDCGVNNQPMFAQIVPKEALFSELS